MILPFPWIPLENLFLGMSDCSDEQAIPDEKIEKIAQIEKIALDEEKQNYVSKKLFQNLKF